MWIRRCAWFTWAFGHLMVVVGGASYALPSATSGPVGRILLWYAAMSGAGSAYGFYAPIVGSQHRAVFTFTDHEGGRQVDTFEQAESLEARLRLSGIVEEAFMTGQAEEHPQWRQHVVKSWAATMFARHPDAVSMTLEVEFLDVPSIPQYRAGSRPEWVTAYRADFQRQKPIGK